MARTAPAAAAGTDQLVGWLTGEGAPVLALHGGPGLSYSYLDDAVAEQGPRLGRVHASELDRHFRRHLTQKLVGGST